MMVEITFQHEVVIVYLLELAKEVLLPDYQFYHLFSYGLTNLLYYALKKDLGVVLLK